ncbi:hypothetical protein Tco_0957816 [Tanacetum coccineum]
MKSGLVSVNTARQNVSKTTVLVNTARQVNAAHTKTTVNGARPMSYLSKIAHSTFKRPFPKNTTFKNSNVNKRVNIVKGNNFNTARPKAVVNAARPKAEVNTVKGNNVNDVKASACWGKSQMDLQDQGSNCSGCSRHMTGKIVLSYKNYERTPTLSFMRPFGCPVTILNTIDHLGNFDGKADECFFVEYSLNSKAFIVFNSRTRIVEENLHIRFSESTPNVIGSGPDWLFDFDALTRTMNYEPIFAGTQSNGFAGTKASNNAGQARKEIESVKDYILLPLWTVDPPFSQDQKSSHDDGSKPSSNDVKKVDEDPKKESEFNVVGENISIELPFDPKMSALEDDSIFYFSSDDEDDGVVADMNNLDTTIQVSPIPTTRIHKDHPLD